jgi:hypothetical protein
LPDFASLEALSVGWDGVNDDGLRYLSGCKNLERLVLSSCNCGGPGLKAIISIKRLKQLSLVNIDFRPSIRWRDSTPPDIKTIIEDGDPIFKPWSLHLSNSTTLANLSKQLDDWLKQNRPGLSISGAYFH